VVEPESAVGVALFVVRGAPAIGFAPPSKDEPEQAAIAIAVIANVAPYKDFIG
jgi:hypothetical protein